MMIKPISTFLIGILFFSCTNNPPSSQDVSSSPVTDWMFPVFTKVDSVNPCLLPSADPSFFCPLRKEEVKWEEKDVFNPTAVVKDGKVYLIYRAEDVVGKHAGTSRLGLAVSEDGYHFEKMAKPIFFPEEDEMKIYEWEGGVEDPRVVESEAGTYIMTYTAWDGKTARLCVASSEDLLNWKKHGLVLGKADDGKYKDLWSKSGAIIVRREGDKLIAHKINGKYWMYWGDTSIFICTSEDLIHWKPLKDADGELLKLFGPRVGKFDSRLVEPGPSPIVTEKGIVMMYNGMNKIATGDTLLADGTYASGQVLIDPNDPTKLLARSESYFMKPDKAYEITGQIGRVCFLEGLVFFNQQWLLYYGTADSKIAVAASADF